MNKIGLVLSGGGARGIAHLGVLQALVELDMRPCMISGVSAGALIGAFFSAGYSPLQILDIAKEQSSFMMARLILSREGFFSYKGLKALLTRYLKEDSFENLEIPLYVTATDISDGTSVTFCKGPLHDVLIGSSSIPALSEPVPVKNYRLLDGGILNNFPVESLQGKCDSIIGCHVNKLYKGNDLRLNRLYLLEKSFHLAIAAGVMQRSIACDVFLEPPLADYGMFEMKDADRIFELGYEYTMAHHDQLLAHKKRAII